MKFITADRAMSPSFYQQDKLALLAPYRVRRLRRGGKAGIVIALPQRRSAMRSMQALPILLAAAFGCQAAPAKDTSAEAKQAIDAANATWARLSAAGHADSLAQYYHPNAMILPPNMAPVHGRDSIRAFFAVLNTMSSPPPVLTVRADSVWASGVMAIDLGRWHFAWPAAAKRPPGMPAADSGKYIVRWVNDNGHWLMAQDIWNSDVALPVPQK